MRLSMAVISLQAVHLTERPYSSPTQSDTSRYGSLQKTFDQNTMFMSGTWFSENRYRPAMLLLDAFLVVAGQELRNGRSQNYYLWCLPYGSMPPLPTASKFRVRLALAQKADGVFAQR